LPIISPGNMEGKEVRFGISVSGLFAATSGGGFYNANSAHPFQNPTTIEAGRLAIKTIRTIFVSGGARMRVNHRGAMLFGHHAEQQEKNQ
jgi:K+-transporting ATPase A subunit